MNREGKEESTELERLLTKNEVADKWQISRRTLDYLVSTGQIPFVRIGQRNVRFQLEKVRSYLEKRQNLMLTHSK